MKYLSFTLIFFLVDFIFTQSNPDPFGAIGPLNTTYVSKGVVSALGDLPIYTIGSGKQAIIYVYDIYGFDGGRTRMLCDWLASKGYFVILPDFFRGRYSGDGLFNMADYPFSKVYNDDIVSKILPYFDLNGIKNMKNTFAWHTR